MSALDDYLANEQRTQDQRLGQAIHAADWTQTFNGGQSTEALRAQRNVTELVAQAMERKAQLAAQTDLNAAKIYETNAKTKEFLEQAPLRDAHLRAQIDAAGAATRYKQQQDTATAAQVSELYNDIAGIQSPIGTPEHAATFSKIIGKYPLAAMALGVQDDIRIHAQAHDTAAGLTKALQDYRTATGFEPSSIETTATGGVNLRGKASEAGNVPTTIMKRYAALQGQIAGHAVAANIQAKKNTKENKPDEPYEHSGAWAAAEREARALEAKYPDLLIQDTQSDGEMNPAVEAVAATPVPKRKALDEIFK